MTPTLSRFLDVLRFASAFTVFLSHYAARPHSEHLFWQVGTLRPGSRSRVFLLSGFVIAWVSETSERTLEEYCLSRFARLYSVILPAFIAMAAIDGCGIKSRIERRLGTGLGPPLLRLPALRTLSRCELDLVGTAGLQCSLFGH
jgi:peptidoglycan/LPS O-acetylase OafA/YrhL